MIGTNHDDKVTLLIRHCFREKGNAKALFQHLIAEQAMSIDLPDGRVTLSRQEHDEFVERFSAEVEPTLWESKRLKH